MRIVYATRRSALALVQCRAFVARLREAHAGLEAIEEQIVTTGDRIQDRPLSDVGGKGLFVKEIEEALLDGRADFAVHSIKDVPGALPPGLVLTCIPEREDPLDVLVSRGSAAGGPRAEISRGSAAGGPRAEISRGGTLAELPPGARVGTSSLRRATELLRARPDLVVLPIRGNVDTRLRKLDAGQYDAIVLARAGLKRLGLEARIDEVLAAEICLPAVGQGALGIECREDDAKTRELLSAVHDEVTGRCVAAERGVLIALMGDCKTPLAAYAERIETGPRAHDLRLRAFVADRGEYHVAEDRIAWPASDAEAAELGARLGNRLAGAKRA